MHNAKLVAYTQPVIEGEIITPDEFVAFCARVSNPDNQMNHESAPNLLNYLAENKHWSPFEMANMVVEVNTTLPIATQMLRHRSFSFQQFSQRYAEVVDAPVLPEMRKKGSSNRQSSLKVDTSAAVMQTLSNTVKQSYEAYNTLVRNGVALETARNVLPACTPTTMYMNGTVRSWIHYLDLRLDEHTQKEHRLVAISIKECLLKAYPMLSQYIGRVK